MTLPAPLRPIIPAVVVLCGVMMMEFVFLIVGEWQDGNWWSLGVRLSGFITTIIVGFWVKRRFADVKKSFEAPNYPPVTMESLPPKCEGFEKECDEFVWYVLPYCLKCWAISVEKRLS